MIAENHQPTPDEIMHWATESAETGDFEPAVLVEDALRKVINERATDARLAAAAWTDLENRVGGAREVPPGPAVPDKVYPHSIVFNFVNPFYDAENRTLETRLGGGIYNAVQREIREVDHGRNADRFHANRNYHDVHFFPQGVTILEPEVALAFPESRMGLIRHFGQDKLNKFAAFVVESTRTKTFTPTD